MSNAPSHPFIDRNSKVLLDSNLLTILLVAQLGDGEIEHNLGLTDACLFELIQHEKTVLLTADLDLYGFAVGYHLPAINFNHLRNL